MSIELEDVFAARRRLQDALPSTPCRWSALSEQFGMDIWCKHEYLQRTGSFKERGARNALLLLDEPARQRGVIAASAGNHALGLAFHARSLGIPATVVMPQYAPLVKSEACKRYGARVLFHGDNIQEAKERADELAAANGLTYIHGFDDAAIMAGQGTLAIEVIEQVPKPDAVIIPIGGGGLIAGMGLVLTELAPQIEVIGVEPERCASFRAAAEAGQPVRIQARPTLADGLAVPQVGPHAFALARQHVDRVLTVNEEELAQAVVRLMEVERCVVEASGAAPLAALLNGKLDHLKGKRVVLVLCGANIDLAVIGRIIDTGLAHNHHLFRFQALISDRPGGLAAFAALLGRTGASIRDVTHDRTFAGADVSQVSVHCVVQTRDGQHIEEIKNTLRAAGVQVGECSE